MWTPVHSRVLCGIVCSMRETIRACVLPDNHLRGSSLVEWVKVSYPSGWTQWRTRVMVEQWNYTKWHGCLRKYSWQPKQEHSKSQDSCSTFAPHNSLAYHWVHLPGVQASSAIDVEVRMEEKTVPRLFRIWRSKAIVGWLIWGISSWSKSYRELLRITRGNDTESKMLLQNPKHMSIWLWCFFWWKSCSRWDRTWGWWRIHSILVPSALAL